MAVVPAGTGGRQARAWANRKFYVQIERCTEMDELKGSSVRHDEEKYVRCSAALTQAIEKTFDGLLRAEVVGVSSFYAMEVRVMPIERLPQLIPLRRPRQGGGGRLSAESIKPGTAMVQEGLEATVGTEADEIGAQLIFSKINAKKWPVMTSVIADLKEFCKVDVRVTLLGQNVLQQGRQDRNRRPPSPQTAVGNISKDAAAQQGRVERQALSRAEIICTATNGDRLALCTNSRGVADAILYPGRFRFRFDEDSAYDAVTPEEIEVQPEFRLQEVTLVATMKKKCTFYVVDHLNRPSANFPLRLYNRSEPELKPILLKTKPDGKCRALLKKGEFVAVHGPDEDPDSAVAPLEQRFSVEQTEIPQVIKLVVHRVKIDVDIMLETKFKEPVAQCPFSIRRPGDPEPRFRGISNDTGLVRAEIVPGRYQLHLEAPEQSPYVPFFFDFLVNEDGSFQPTKHRVNSKVVDVSMSLVTPDGEPAVGCSFSIASKFPDQESALQSEIWMRSNEAGVAKIRMGLLEPHRVRILDTGKGPQEYMPQDFTFQTDRQTVTAVVAKSIFGEIQGNSVALLLDLSGSMGCYLEEIRSAVRSVILRQFDQTDRLFNLIAYTNDCVPWRPDVAAACVPENINDALRFVDDLSSGGGNDLFRALELAFKSPSVDTVYLLSDGKHHNNESFVHRVKQLFYAHANRPKVNTITLNCVPRRKGWRVMQAVALLTHGVFRPVCLEQGSNNSSSSQSYRSNPGNPGIMPLRRTRDPV